MPSSGSFFEHYLMMDVFLACICSKRPNRVMLPVVSAWNPRHQRSVSLTFDAASTMNAHHRYSHIDKRRCQPGHVIRSPSCVNACLFNRKFSSRLVSPLPRKEFVELCGAFRVIQAGFYHTILDEPLLEVRSPRMNTCLHPVSLHINSTCDDRCTLRNVDLSALILAVWFTTLKNGFRIDFETCFLVNGFGKKGVCPGLNSRSRFGLRFNVFNCPLMGFRGKSFVRRKQTHKPGCVIRANKCFFLVVWSPFPEPYHLMPLRFGPRLSCKWIMICRLAWITFRPFDIIPIHDVPRIAIWRRNPPSALIALFKPVFNPAFASDCRCAH
ncbi:MAG: hypothetical protein BWY82_02919 [Verrucomicrobia bacterium ADurb.Bin474]|nr:MAG: hypothetical protein BWY82_02919 [Verrucomicrobia bacterium ADurb.Bin474]